MKRSTLIRTIILFFAISFIVIYPLLPLNNSQSNNLFTLLRETDANLAEVKATAANGNATGAKVLLHAYFTNRSLEPYSKVSSSNLTAEMQRANLTIRRIFTINEETYSMFNCSGAEIITVNGREIFNTNWHRNPNVKDDEWIWGLSRWGWLGDLARSYLGNKAIGNDSLAEYYAAALVDFVTDFIQKEPVGSMWSWRTIDSAIRISSAIGAVDAIKNSSAFTPEFCYIFLRLLVDHGKYLADYHKIQYNWAFIESGGVIELCSYLPEIISIDSWQNIAWNQFEKSIDTTFYPDGGSREQAINYHKVATGRLANAMLIAQQFDHINSPPSLENKLVRMYVYLLHNTMPDYYSTTFGDSHQNYHKWEIGKGSRLCDDYELDYFDVNGNPIGGNTPPRINVQFPDSGLFISRSTWNDSDALYSLFDGGPYGEFYHAHYDFGCIELYAFNRRLILDPGRYTYTLDEMSRYFLESYSHNVVLIDNEKQGKINPSSSSWAAGYLGSCARAANTYYGAILEREVLFANFRNNITNDPNLTCFSTSNDIGRYWIVSDFWEGSGTHEIELLWQMPKFDPIFIDNASSEIDLANVTQYIRCLTTNFANGNLGVYGFGPWTQLQNITAGTSAEYGKPYGWYSPTMYVLEEATTLRFMGSVTDPSHWFTVLYPSQYSPNITVTTPLFLFNGETYKSGGMGTAPGNVIYVEHDQGAELHISLAEPTSAATDIELNLSGYKINFEGRQITLHFNLSNHITQISTQYLKKLSINDEELLTFSVGVLNVSANTDLNALTCGLEPSDSLNGVYIGPKLLPTYYYGIENNAINLGTFILGGDF